MKNYILVGVISSLATLLVVIVGFFAYTQISKTSIIDMDYGQTPPMPTPVEVLNFPQVTPTILDVASG